MDNRVVTLSVVAGIAVIIGIFFTFQLEFSESSISNQEKFEPKFEEFSLDSQNPIKVGILHSLTGTMAISETPVVDATLLAIDEINEKGGLLGRPIHPIVVDGASDLETFANQAEYLITEEEVSAVFGGWTSASRKTMLPIFEKHENILFYPVQYEGLEQSKNIVYTGAAPNQQVIPGVEWAYENLGKKFFLVGSDYVFPRSANEIIKSKIQELGGTIVGEEYELLGSNSFDHISKKILNSQPDVILNTINGDSNIWFFKSLREHGITSKDIPTVSFSIAENEIRFLGTHRVSGDYASWNYFQSLDIPENHYFIKNFQSRYGNERVTADPMEAGYIGVHLFAKAVEKSKSDNPKIILQSIKGMTFAAPGGIVGIDPETQHLAKVVRIGQILETGQFQIVSSSEEPIPPIPYPSYKSQDEWDAFLDDLYNKWGNKWENSLSANEVSVI